jgi:hypothetical protein
MIYDAELAEMAKMLNAAEVKPEQLKGWLASPPGFSILNVDHRSDELTVTIPRGTTITVPPGTYEISGELPSSIIIQGTSL